MAPATLSAHHSHMWLVATLLVSVQRKHFHHRSKFHRTVSLYIFNVLPIHWYAFQHLLLLCKNGTSAIMHVRAGAIPSFSQTSHVSFVSPSKVTAVPLNFLVTSSSVRTDRFENLKFLMKRQRIILQASSPQKQNGEGITYVRLSNSNQMILCLKTWILPAMICFHCNHWCTPRIEFWLSISRV